MAEPPRPDRIVVAADVTPDLSIACIVIAGCIPGDRILVEIGIDPQDRRDHRAGIAWVVPRLKELRKRHRVAAVVIDPASPAGTLLVEMTRGSLEPVLPNGRETGQSFGQFLDWVRDRRLVHMGDLDMRKAVAGAQSRDIGDGQRAWSRRHSPNDITPLCAATLAAWGAYKFARPRDLSKTVAGPT